MQNHFALFHLPEQFSIDAAALDQAYHQVQNQVHPDKFVSGSDAEKRVAMQWATRANEAYQILRKPLPRARYLCELHGIDLQTESNTAMPMAFLLQQMGWREALDEIKSSRDAVALEALDAELQAAWRAMLDGAGALLDQAAYVEAAQEVRKLMFLDKLRDELTRWYDTLEH
ncbi:MAG: Fe-S protein assembly co-chaperone HscB [Pseudomonadota bacterium]|nr:Fe-S protein assembly co-chaperone HscB [Pseudomonadota bacterium]